MHLGNGAITPECGAVALGVAAMGVGAAFVGTHVLGLERKRAYTAAGLGTAVFAAQLFNVKILPFRVPSILSAGSSLAWVLSPPLGALTMAGILTLQAVLLGDGGLLALGANIINMGLHASGGRGTCATSSPGCGKIDSRAAGSLWTLGNRLCLHRGGCRVDCP